MRTELNLIEGWPRVTEAKTYAFKFDPYGWANVTINDTTGEISIQSDWTNVAYRMHTNALPEQYNTPTKFFIHCCQHDPDYMLRKMRHATGREQPDLKDVVNEKATVKSVKKAVKEWYQGLSAKRQQEVDYKSLLEELSGLDWDNEHEVWEAMSYGELSKWAAYEAEWYFHVETERSVDWRFLEEVLLPLLGRVLPRLVSSDAA